MTGTTWFNIMTEQEQNEFIHAYNAQQPMRGKRNLINYLSLDFDNFRGFMMYSFTWYDAPQGSDYWLDVLNTYRDVQPLVNFHFKKGIKEFTL